MVLQRLRCHAVGTDARLKLRCYKLALQLAAVTGYHCSGNPCIVTVALQLHHIHGYAVHHPDGSVTLLFCLRSAATGQYLQSCSEKSVGVTVRGAPEAFERKNALLCTCI